MRWVILICLLAVTIIACQRDDDQSDHPALWSKPIAFPEPHYSYDRNDKDVEVFELGRDLFYDPILSLDSTISCASCHHQSHAFSDTVALSRGVHGRVGVRNSPPLINLAWNTSFMWDGGVNHIEVFSVAPITDSAEMALPLARLGERLNSSPYYSQAFKRAMDSDSITDRQYLLALTQFMGALIANDSPYDRYVKGEHDAISTKAQEGLAVFNTFCQSCHQPPLFTDYSFRRNGTYREGGDMGRYLITLQEGDIGRFKVPTLRQISLTGPYMHDGRLESLQDVINHYRTVATEDALIDQALKGVDAMTDEEADALLSFLMTLTDDTLQENPYFSKPLR